MSLSAGRPLRIHREDYDTQLPDVDNVSRHSVYSYGIVLIAVCDERQEDFQLWMPYRSTAAAQRYNPLPGRITSCFRSFSSIGGNSPNQLSKYLVAHAGAGRRYSRNIRVGLAQIIRREFGVDHCPKTCRIDRARPEITALVHGVARCFAIHDLPSASSSHPVPSYDVLVLGPTFAVFSVGLFLFYFGIMV